MTPPKLDDTFEMSDLQFRKFAFDWKRFVEEVNLIPAQWAHTLYTRCCPEEIQHRIIDEPGDFFTLESTEALKTLKRIVTKQHNPIIHRISFHNIKQSDSESIATFHHRLVQAAKDCDYQCPHCNEGISSMLIRDQFIYGIYNEALKSHILSKMPDELKTLEEIITYARSQERGENEQALIKNVANVHAAQFQHNNPRGPRKFQTGYTANTRNRKCIGCGSTSHWTYADRQKKCKAFGCTCHKCGKPNHWESVCLPKSKLDGSIDTDDYKFKTVDSDEAQFIGALEAANISNGKNWHNNFISTTITPISHASVAMTVFPDSGAVYVWPGHNTYDN